MSSTKISALTAKTTPAGTEEFVINDSGVSKKITADNITENNFTDLLKTKLDGIATSANNYTHPTGAGNEHLPSTVSQTEAGYLDGVTSAIQTQLNTKLASGGTLATATITTLTSTTANITTVDWGNWTVTESAGVLYFASLGVNKAKLDASGNFTCVGDVISNGTI